MKHKFNLFNRCMVMLVAMMTIGVGSVWGETAAVNSATPTDGKSYIIAIYYNSEYYALPNLTSATGVTPTGKKCTLANGKVTAIADCSTPDACLWTLSAVSGKSSEYKIYCTSGSTKYYLCKNGTTGGTNYNISGSSSTQNGWAFSLGTANNVTAYSVKTTKSGATKNTVLYGYNGKFEVYGTDDAFHITLLEIASSQTSVTAEVAEGQSTMGSVILYDSKWKEQTDNKGDFDKDAIAILYASNEDNYRFINWTLTAETDATWNGDYSATDYLAELKVGSKDVTATAHFAQEYTISVTQNDDKMGVADFKESHSGKFIAGEQAQVEAVVDDATKYEFVNWTVSPANAVTFANATAATTTITATAQTATVTANFQTKTTKYAAYITVNESTYGSATINGDDTGVEVAAGTEMTVAASNNTGYVFKNWSADPSASVTFTDASAATTTFTMPSSEVTVTANFEEAPAAVLTLSENGTTREYKGIKVNTPFNLPTCQVSCDKVFMGWSESSTSYATLYKAGDSYTMTATTGTLYAWFATETEGTVTWTKVSSVTAGQYIIINNSTYLDNTTTSSAPAQGTAPTITKDVIANKDVTSNMIWNFSDAGEGKFYVKNGEDKYLYETNNNNGLRVGSTSDTWTIETNGTGSAMKGTNNSRYCASYSSGSDWRSYTSKDATNYGDGGKLYFYKKTTGSASYSDYSLTCSNKTAAPVFSPDPDTYTSAQSITITAEDGATIYYTTDGSDPKESQTKQTYTEAISLSTYGTTTFKAYAVATGKSASDVVEATYFINIPFASLQALVDADLPTNSPVVVSFGKTLITKVNYSKKNISLDIQKDSKDIQIYCSSTAAPEEWNAEAGYALSATNLSCTWARYPESGELTCWELMIPNWDGITYSAPDPYTTLAALYDAAPAAGTKVYLDIEGAYIHTITSGSGYKYVYIQQGTVGIVLRATEFDDANIGKNMDAYIVGNFNPTTSGRPQIEITSIEAEYSVGTRPEAATTTLTEAEESSQILSLVQFSGYYAQSQAKQQHTAVITANADGTGSSYTIYDNFGTLGTVPPTNKAINVTGLFYKKTDNDPVYCVAPVLTTDVALVTSEAAAAATVDKGSTDKDNPTKVGNGEIITITPADGFTASYIFNDAAEKTITAATEKITMTQNSTLVLKSSRDYFEPTSNTYYYELDEKLTYHSITKPVGNFTCDLSAAAAKQGDEVTITFTMNEHWYMDGVTVKKVGDESTSFAATKQSDNVYSFEMPAYDVTLSTSTHSDPKYDITYLKNGKQTTPADEITESKQFAGTELTLKSCEWTASGVEYDGWKAYYVDENNGNKEIELPITNNTITVPAHNVKIYAQWVNVYAVTFDRGTAPATGDAPTVTPKREGAKFNLPANQWAAIGYSFAGWKASSDDQIYQAGAEFTMLAAAVTFTAQWDGAEYTKDGQWELVTSKDQLEAGRYYVIGNSQYSKTMTATEAGSTNKRLTSVTSTYSDGDVQGDKAIIKKADLNASTAVFQLGGETGAWTLMNIANDKYYHTGSKGNPEWLDADDNALWSITYSNSTASVKAIHGTYTSDSTLQYYNDNTESNCGFRPYTSSQKAVQLYRFYRAAFKVTYDANGGTGAPVATKADPTTQIATLSNTVPTKTGNTFTGWTTAQGGTGTKYQAGAQFGPMTKNETLYAQWELKTYNVAIASVEHAAVFAKQKYTSDENKFGEGESKDIQYGKTVTLSYNSVEENYVFKSWNVTKATDPSTTITVTDNEFVVPDYAVSISAVFEKSSEAQFTLTYDANGGEGTMEGNPFTKGYNAYITVSNNKNGEEDIFTKDLCTFTGWNTKEDGSGTAYAAGAHFYIKSDVTLYAQWKGTGATYRLDNSYEGKIKVTVGTAPQGSNAVYSNTFNGDARQVSQGNTMTITLTGYDNMVVKNINADMRSNGSNSANINIAVGGNLVYSKKYADLGADNKSQYQNIDLIEFGFNPIKIGDGQSIVFTITSPTQNSAYIQNITLEFGAGYSRTFTSHNVSTVCVPYAVKPEDRFGAAFYEIAYKTQATDDESTKIYFDEVAADEPLVAGKPYVIIPEGGTLALLYSGSKVNAPVDGDKGLTGTFDGIAKAATNDLNGNYIFNSNKYWLCGGNCWLDANRAYIKADVINASCTPVPSAPGRRRIVMGANGTEEVTIPNTPTAINTIGETELGELQKLIINNQIIIIRNGQMYNAQGALMK